MRLVRATKAYEFLSALTRVLKEVEWAVFEVSSPMHIYGSAG